MHNSKFAWGNTGVEIAIAIYPNWPDVELLITFSEI